MVTVVTIMLMLGLKNFIDLFEEYIEKYKVAKKTAKRAVSEAKGRAYEDLYRL